MARIGYARVSSLDQDLDGQLARLAVEDSTIVRSEKLSGGSREVDVVERPEIPCLSVVLGFGPILLITAGAAAAWLTSDLLRDEIVLATATYAASILAFLAGVRRGLSFRTEGGPAVAQIATMFGLFVLALFALLALGNSLTLPAVIATTIGFGATMVLDPLAARNGQAPLFFERLRPAQMAIAVVSLLTLLTNVWARG